MSKTTRKSSTTAAPELDLNAVVAAAVAQALAAAGVGATATAVAEKVAAKPAEPEVDPLVSFVNGKGYALARGGRTYLDKATLAAAARVLATGTSEIVPVKKAALIRRNVTGVVVFRSDEAEVGTSFVYRP